MATAEEGGATGKTTRMTSTSSYGGGGGGAGGKFRKKASRKPTTPYDRPPVSLRGNDNRASWLTKLVVEPASRLISYGARRLFASLSHKRLPPPPLQKSELNNVSSNGQSEAVPNSQYAAQEPAVGECSQPSIRCSGRGISELEQLLQQKTFTRSEIEHLTDLLHSRAGEVTHKDDEKRNEETTFKFGRSQQFESSMLEPKRGSDTSHAVVSTTIPNSKVLGNSVASPSDVAKVYMGSIPSNSMLQKYSQVTTEDNRLPGNMWVASKPPSMSLITKTAVSPGSPANGFITAQRSRGRSAIYNMARSPHLRGSRINHNGYAGLTMPSSSVSLVENSERSEARSLTLKRRSYVLDDDIGSGGHIRRIRQKSNLLLSGIPRTNGVGISSDAIKLSSKQKLPLIGDPEHVPYTAEEINGNSIPSTSYAQVSNEPREAAARTSKYPEELTSNEESSKTKLVNVHGQAFKLTPSMLRGQALRSMEDVRSAELIPSFQDDYMFESRSDATSSDAHDSQEQRKVEENHPLESRVSSDMCYPVIVSDPVVSLKTSWVGKGASDSVIQNGVSQPEYKRAFRMSALEDYVDLDDEDDIPCNGIVPPSFVESGQQLGTNLTNCKPSSAGELEHVKTTIQQEVKSPSGFASSISSELKGASVGECNNGITTPTSEEASVAAQSASCPPSVALFDKPKQTNDLPPVFSFSSKVADKFPSLTPESSSRTPETKPESSSSLLNVSAPNGSSVKRLELENGDHMESLVPEDRNGKSDTIPSASSNGPLVLSVPVGSFNTALFNNASQISTSGPAIFTPSTSVSTVFPSGTGDTTLATSSSSILGPAATPTILGGPIFKFGGSSDPPAEVSVASTVIIPAGQLKSEAVKDSTTNSVGTVSQGSSVHPFSFAPSNTDIAPPVSSLSSSQVFNTVTQFGFNSSASSSGTGAIVSGSGPASSIFGVNTKAVSDGSSASSSSVAFPSMFSFGLNSSSSSANATRPTGSAAPPVFGFGLSSSVSASASTFSSTAVSASGGVAPPAFGFGASSSNSASASTFSTTAVSSSGGVAPPAFSFGASSSNSGSASTFSTTTVSSSGGVAAPAFSFGASSSNSASVTNAMSSLTNGTLGVFNFGGSSSATSSAINSVNGDPTPFGSNWQTPKSTSIFASTPTSASPANGFTFGASAAAPSSSLIFPFTTSSASAQPAFGNSASGFAASPGNSYQMNGEDSMAEDPVQSTAPSVAVFGQPSVPPPSGFMFGMTAPAPAPGNPFQFGGQQNQGAPQNPPMFQASGSHEFNAGGGSFSLGSGGGDKSGRKFVKVNRSKNRKK